MDGCIHGHGVFLKMNEHSTCVVTTCIDHGLTSAPHGLDKVPHWLLCEFLHGASWRGHRGALSNPKAQISSWRKQQRQESCLSLHLTHTHTHTHMHACTHTHNKREWECVACPHTCTHPHTRLHTHMQLATFLWLDTNTQQQPEHTLINMHRHVYAQH